MTDPTSLSFETFRAALAVHESSGNASAVQWDTKARGLFQFIPKWHAKWIQEETGRSLDSFMPQDSSEAEMARATKEQSEILFPKYFKREIEPFINRARKEGLGKGYTDAQLGAMAHFAGSAGAREYLKTGKDATLGTAGNAEGGIASYVKSFSNTYNSDPVAVFEERSKTSKHYGEVGLGRGVYAKYVDRDVSTARGRNDANRELYGRTAEGEKRKTRVVDSPSDFNFAGGGQITGIFSGSAEALANKDRETLALMENLAARLGSSVSDEQYLNRLRKEGSGLG